MTFLRLLRAYRSMGKDLYKFDPRFFCQLNFSLSPLYIIESSVPDIHQNLLTRACHAMGAFCTQDGLEEMMPQSLSQALPLFHELQVWAGEVPTDRYDRRHFGVRELLREVDSFITTLYNDLERTHHFSLTDKGILSVDAFVEGASKFYPPDVLPHLDKTLCDEINAAGKCFMFAQYTASGFHALRSVEFGVMAYIVAATGALPNPQNRGWRTYIGILKALNPKASSDLTDVLLVLNARRNPLMHPEESLDLTEARHIFCICEAVTCELVKDCQAKNLNLAKAFADLPALLKATRP